MLYSLIPRQVPLEHLCELLGCPRVPLCMSQSIPGAQLAEQAAPALWNFWNPVCPAAEVFSSKHAAQHHPQPSRGEFLACLERRAQQKANRAISPQPCSAWLPAGALCQPNFGFCTGCRGTGDVLRCGGSSTHLGCSWRCARGCSGFWRRS